MESSHSKLRLSPIALAVVLGIIAHESPAVPWDSLVSGPCNHCVPAPTCVACNTSCDCVGCNYKPKPPLIAPSS